MTFSTIAIDGPAASGKSTAAETLARRLGYLYFDTGVMYRAVTLAALRRLGGVDLEDEVVQLADKVMIDVRPPSIGDGRAYDVLLDGEDVTWQIRAEDVNCNVSVVSAYPGVRESMTRQQRRIGERGHVVMVGRDIGTVVMPDADAKFYIDASAEVRAQRRYEEMIARGDEVEFPNILLSIKKRDLIDSTREIAPLRMAEDAIHIITDTMSREEVVVEMLEHLSQKEA
jgi:cytidylate kinase